MPLQESNLQRFVASLVHRIGFKSIKVYLSGIQYWALMCGDSAHISSMSRLFYLLRGIRRIQGNLFRRHRRTPITVSQLHLIHYRLQFLRYSNFERSMFRAMASLAFFGLLRCSEYTSAGRHHFAASNTLLFQDISFANGFSIMHIFIRASKTDPSCYGCTIHIAAISGVLCPVRLMRQYFRCHPSRQGPLFVLSLNRYLVRQDVAILLHRYLPGVSAVNTHSFRIGGASAAASMGVPDSHIQILGRWSSNAYLHYLHLSDDIVARYCNSMVLANSCSRVWDPILCVSQTHR